MDSAGSHPAQRERAAAAGRQRRAGAVAARARRCTAASHDQEDRDRAAARTACRRAETARRPRPGRTENNYEQFVRYLVERDHLNERGRAAMVAAFEIDRQAEALPTKAPGCGGFLMEFALEQQDQLDAGDAATQALNRTEDSVFGRASDNDRFQRDRRLALADVQGHADLGAVLRRREGSRQRRLVVGVHHPSPADRHAAGRPATGVG